MVAGSIGIAVTLGGTVLLAGPVWADSGTVDDSAAACTLTVVITPTTGTNHGGTIVVSVSSDCGTGSGTLTVVAKNKPIGSISIDENGNGSSEIVLPCRVGPGTQTIAVTDTNGNTGSASLDVTSGPCASAPGHTKSPGATDTSADPNDADSASVATNPTTDAAPASDTSATGVTSAG
jgi:hypothetical protein